MRTLRRPRARTPHAWRLFRSRDEAGRYAREALAGDDEARRWGERISAEDFEDLIRRLGLPPGA